MTTLPTYVAAGAGAAGGTTITPALPTGHALNDILLLCCESANQAVTATGYTSSGVTGGVGTNGGASSTRSTILWKRDNGSEVAPTTNNVGDHVLGFIIAVRGCVTTGDPTDVAVLGSDAVSNTSVSATGLTTLTPNDFVVVAISSGFDSATGQFSAWANAGLANFAHRQQFADAGGNGGCISVSTGEKAAAGVVGATTATLANAFAKGFVTIALKPADTAETSFVGAIPF